MIRLSKFKGRITKHLWPSSIASFAPFTAGIFAGSLGVMPAGQAQTSARVYESRTYTSHEGKLEDDVARFRNHTTKLFEKHGMTNIGYWLPREQPNTPIDIISHVSRHAATKSWYAFRKDPDWVAARTASEVNGPIVAKTHSAFMDPTNFSGLK